MKAVNHYVIVDRIKEKQKETSGLILDENKDEQLRYFKGKVISAGNLVEVIKEGDIDPTTNQPYNIENVRDQIDQLNFQIEKHSDHLETKIGMAAAAKQRGISKASSAEQQLNYELLIGKRFGADGLQQKLDRDKNSESYGKYLYYDATVGKHVPISEFNIGSAYDKTLANNIDRVEEQIRKLATNMSIRKEPALFANSKANLISDMESYLEENPDAAKNLLFEDKQFKSYLNPLIPDVDDLTPDQYNAAIEDLKQRSRDDYNEVFLKGYESMIDNTFENSLVPVPERVSTKEKNLGDFPGATDEEIAAASSVLKTNKDKYESTDKNVETETTETPEEKQPVTLAQQMLDTKRPSISGLKAYNKFNKKELRNALSSGEIDEEILKKYLVQIPGISILEGEVKGLENVSAGDFNSAMRKLQQETKINLGYNI